MLRRKREYIGGKKMHEGVQSFPVGQLDLHLTFFLATVGIRLLDDSTSKADTPYR